MKVFLVAILTLGYFMKPNAQVPPNLDPNYELVTSKSDEFTSSSLDQTKWDNCANIGIGWGYGSYLSASNVILDAGYLRLRWSRTGSTMRVGQIRSKNSNYSYGYFEISAKILDPGNYKNGIPCATGLWPSFWTYYTGDLPCYHDEIDIVETLYKDCKEVNIMGSNIHDKEPESTDPTASDCNGLSRYANRYNYNQPLFEDEHKYAAEWLSDRVILYFDDQPVGIYYGNGIPQHTQYVVLSMQTNTSWVDFDGRAGHPRQSRPQFDRLPELPRRHGVWGLVVG